MVHMIQLLVAALIVQSLPAPPATRLEMREVFWGDRQGRLRHRPIAFAGERPIEGAAFYLAVDRPDLAAEYRRREATAEAVAGVGLLGVVAGAIGAGVIVHDRAACARPDDGCDVRRHPWLA